MNTSRLARAMSIACAISIGHRLVELADACGQLEDRVDQMAKRLTQVQVDRHLLDERLIPWKGVGSTEVQSEAQHLDGVAEFGEAGMVHDGTSSSSVGGTSKVRRGLGAAAPSAAPHSTPGGYVFESGGPL